MNHTCHASTATKFGSLVPTAATCEHIHKMAGGFIPYLVAHDKKVEAVVTEDHVLTDTANLETAHKNLMRPNWFLGGVEYHRPKRVRLERRANERP